MSKYKDVAKLYIHQCKTQSGNSWEVSEEYLFFDIPRKENLNEEKWAIELPIILRAHGLKMEMTKNPNILKISKEKVETKESKEILDEHVELLKLVNNKIEFLKNESYNFSERIDQTKDTAEKRYWKNLANQREFAIQKLEEVLKEEADLYRK